MAVQGPRTFTSFSGENKADLIGDWWDLVGLVRLAERSRDEMRSKLSWGKTEGVGRWADDRDSPTLDSPSSVPCTQY